ncbi:MAG TPA: ABC transporter ATP-binding protein [Armatimonadetes bacterium]|nr:ABC transporter ATP-binding protein [Armatimonadota bacterium]
MDIEIRALGHIYPGNITALRDVSLSIGPGVFALLGPNGAGKTTLMRILATLLEPTYGEVQVDGQDLFRQKALVRRQLGYLPQDFGLYGSLTVYETLDYFGLLYHLTGKEERERAIETALEQTHLTEVRKQRVGTLSGGMRQRLGLAQAMLNSPQLLIVDEPTAGLDPEERVRFRSLLAELGADRTVILSTHIVADVEAVADTLAVLHEGEVRFYGRPEQLLARIADRVWQVELDREELVAFKEQHLVTGVFRAANRMQVRLVAESLDHPRARQVSPALEDAYIWLMGGGRQDV